MQVITQSLQLVLTSSGFSYNMSMIIVIGIVAGTKFNEYLIGFKRSVAILIPFVLILLTTNFFRIYEITKSQNITINAYNGSVAIVLTTVCYVIGLFLGHVVFHKAKRDAQKELDETSGR